MTISQKVKPPKAGPFLKEAMAFGRTFSKDALKFLVGFFLLSFVAGLWLRGFSFEDTESLMAALPFLTLTAVSLFPIYIYGTRQALGLPNTVSYFSHFVHKDFWRVLSYQGVIMLVSGVSVFVIETVLSLFISEHTVDAGMRPVPLLVGAFASLILTHAASGRVLKINQVMHIAYLGFGAAIAIYCLFFALPIILVTVIEVFVLTLKDAALIAAALIHAALMGLLGYVVLCGSVGFGKLYQTLAPEENVSS